VGRGAKREASAEENRAILAIAFGALLRVIRIT
jgi:hypothetical protein